MTPQPLPAILAVIALVAGALAPQGAANLASTNAATARYAPSMGYNVAHSRESHAMSANAVVRARVDEHIKEEASAVLAAMGLTVSDAFRIMLTRVAREKALPFEPLIPNETTIAAMREARAGKLASFDGVEALMADLRAED
jgi:DNA-damage-inducible protein J